MPLGPDIESLTWLEWLELLFYDSHRIVRRSRAQLPKHRALVERFYDLRVLTCRLQHLPAATVEERQAVQQQIDALNARIAELQARPYTDFQVTQAQRKRRRQSSDDIAQQA